ncbi:ThuA domain-containing protein [Microcella flavibacter]|uniref:ThuA domain-containing protein n=1 Tax=Microcella flavibacter TaxID=1804990 RepID=UPI0014565122|nr:ThuA domain-containing protein [Microcella flavibacter]
MAASRILILSGSGRHGDPWHPFARTSALIAETLAGLDDVTIEVDDDADARLQHLDGIDLLVLNLGDASRPDAEPAPADPEGAERRRTAAAAFTAAGGALLVVHAGSSSLGEIPPLTARMPARWLRPDAWHPEFGTMTAAPTAAGEGHPVTAGLGPVTTQDESYRGMTRHPAAVALLEHREDGAHPIVLALEQAALEQAALEPAAPEGAGPRSIADLLGHDERSYASAARRALLVREAEWLLRRR